MNPQQRFTLQPSHKTNYHVCTDTVNRIVCVFKHRHFNDDQTFTLLDDFPPENYMNLAKYTREMAEWLRENHYNIVMGDG